MRRRMNATSVVTQREDEADQQQYHLGNYVLTGCWHMAIPGLADMWEDVETN